MRRIMIQNRRETASFRDPSGFLSWRDGELFRQIDHMRIKDSDRILYLMEKIDKSFLRTKWN